MRWLIPILVLGIVLGATADMYIFAVNSQGKGVPARLIVDVKPGTGKVSLTLNSLVGEDTQASITSAIKAAVREANKEFEKFDYSVTIEASAEHVSGPSAGLPIAIATYAALLGKDVPDNISATGTIDEKGNVGPVGGIYEKLLAAKDVNVTLFLIPKGERIVKTLVVEEIEPGIQGAVEKEIDVVEKGRELNVEVYEVSTLREAIDIIFEGKKPAISESNMVESEEVNFVPPPASIYYSYRFGDITRHFVEELNTILNFSCQKNGREVNILLTRAKSYLKRAVLLLDRGYYYTAGNYAFLGLIDATVAREYCLHPSIKNPSSLAYTLLKDDLESELHSLLLRAEKIKPNAYNYEWVGGARERIIRAEQSLSKETPSLSDLISAKYWLEAASLMLDVAEEINGPEIKGLDVLAREEIISVEDIALTDPSVKERLKWARTAYERGWYYAAFAEAALAKGIHSPKEGEIRNRVDQLLELTEDVKGLWAELYRNHGVYYYLAAEEYRRVGNTNKEEEMLKTSLQMLVAARELSYLHSILSPIIVSKSLNPTKKKILPPPWVVAAALAVIFFSAALLLTSKKKDPEVEKLEKEIAALKEAKRRLQHLKSEYIAKEINRIDKRIATLEKKLAALLSRQGSSRPSRGRHRLSGQPPSAQHRGEKQRGTENGEKDA